MKHHADLTARDIYGATPLHAACHSDQPQTLELLLMPYAEVNAMDNEGWRPVHLAANFGRKDLVKLLLSRGAHENLLTRYAQTPLHLASKEGHLNVVNELLSEGADTSLEDLHGNRALDYAKTDTVRSLIKVFMDRNNVAIKKNMSTVSLNIDLYMTSEEVEKTRSEISKAWNSTPKLTINGVSGEGYMESLSENERATISKFQRQRESTQLSVHDNLKSLPSLLDTQVASIGGHAKLGVQNSVLGLISTTDERLDGLTKTFADFFSSIAFATDNSEELSRETLKNVVSRLTGVQEVIENFREDFQNRTGNLYTSLAVDSDAQNQSENTANPNFIALTSLFLECFVEVLANSSGDPDIWRKVLEHIHLDRDTKALLTVQMQFDSDATTVHQKLKRIVLIWSKFARDGALGKVLAGQELMGEDGEKEAQFMRSLLHVVNQCGDTKLGTTGDELVVAILKDFIEKYTDLRTGKHFNHARLTQSRPYMFVNVMQGLLTIKSRTYPT